jgi:hypothetical protein
MVEMFSLFCSVADPDPGSGAFLTPGSGIRDPGWVKNRIRIRDDQHGSYFRELRNQFFGLKYLIYLIWIRDPGWKTLAVGQKSALDPHFLWLVPDLHLKLLCERG